MPPLRTLGAVLASEPQPETTLPPEVERILASMQQSAVRPPVSKGALILSTIGDALAGLARARGERAPDATALDSILQYNSDRQAAMQNAAERTDLVRLHEILGQAQEARGERREIAGEERAFKRQETATPELLRTRTAILDEAYRRGAEFTNKDIQSYLLTGSMPHEGEEVDLGELSLVGSRGVSLPEDLDPRGISGEASKFAREKLAKTATGKEEKGKFADFNSFAELRTAIDSAARQRIDSSSQPNLVKTGEIDPATGKSKVRVVNQPSISLDEAYRWAISRYPGAEKFFALPEGPVGGGPSIDVIRRKLVERNAQ